MRNRIEVPFQVRVIHSLETSLEVSADFFQCLMRRAVGTETIGAIFKVASKIGSRINRVPICTKRSRTVGIPSGLIFPLAFGMYTRRTGWDW